MKRVSAIVLLAMMVCGALAAAQAPEPRKPGAEEKNLAYFAGNWKLDGNLKPGPMGPGGKFAGSEHNEWLPGGFYLVSHSQGSSAMGKEIGLAIFGYDPEKKVYTYDAYNNMGEASVHGSVKGDEVRLDFEASGAQIHYVGKLDGTGVKMEGTVDYGGQASGTFTATKKEDKEKKFHIAPSL